VREGVPPAVIFGFFLLFVFLILAALYESWSLPFSVLLSTPVAVFNPWACCGCAASCWDSFSPYMVQIESDVYAQIGLDADRPGREERDPDCGIRPGRTRKEQALNGS
jgi:HAE1 family hydrophobic/amphiphilic exporter-1